MELPNVVTAAIALLAVTLSLVNIVLNRGQDTQKSIGELALQIANLRTELAQQEITRQKDMEARFASRESQALHAEALAFVRALTVEVHRRMYPDAAIHQPGAR
jgi:hypothetical protein